MMLVLKMELHNIQAIFMHSGTGQLKSVTCVTSKVVILVYFLYFESH